MTTLVRIALIAAFSAGIAATLLSAPRPLAWGEGVLCIHRPTGGGQ
jgi:hypothetical protein